MTVIVDYGLGNLGSILNMLRKVLAADIIITKDPELIRTADRLILSGVGAFDAGMERIQSSGLREVLEEAALIRRKPVLGICLGMQLLTRGSEEGTLPGLGWIDAHTRRFEFQGELAELKVPHMGWNEVRFSKRHALVEGMPEPSRFYFVHSYHVCCDHSGDELMSSQYGIEFTSAIQNGNIMGVQFHPEKSHRFGMQLLKNFTSL